MKAPVIHLVLLSLLASGPSSTEGQLNLNGGVSYLGSLR